MSAEDGVRRTLARYCQLFDAKQWDDLGRIFDARPQPCQPKEHPHADD